MKVLDPAVTCLVTSHMKPYLRGLLESLLAQTRLDFEAVVLDSGQWIGRDDDRSREMAQIHADFASHPLIWWTTTGELPGLASRACPSPWTVNTAIRAGVVRGRYMCIVSDDDLYRPGFMELMAGYLDGHTDALAVFCSMDLYKVTGDGRSYAGSIMAGSPRGAGGFDCQVDGQQMMYRTSLLETIGAPWMNENPDLGSCGHADGLWLERVAAAAGEVHAVPEVLCEHQFTPLSTYSPS